MPLMKGSDQNTISYNIHEMRANGHPETQSIAAAMRMAGKHKAKTKKKKMKADPEETGETMPDNESDETTMMPAKAGQKPITFHEGGLHASTGTKAGAKIPASKHAAAASGRLGPKAKKQEMFYRNVLKH